MTLNFKGAACIAALTVSGCASVAIEDIRNERTQEKIQAGKVITGSLAYALPKTVIDVLQSDDGRLDLQTRLVADPEHVYRVNYVPSPFSDDTWDISVDPVTGLLASVSLSLEDKTDTIVEKAAESAGVLTPLFSGDDPNFTFLTSIDLSNSASFLEAQNALQGLGISGLTCTGACGGGAPRVKGAQSTILHRAPMPMEISFVNDQGRTQTFYLSSVTQSPILGVPAVRSFGVKRDLTVVIQNGIVKQVVHKKPSEFVELATLPARAAKAYIGGVASGLSELVKIPTEDKKLTQAQIDLLKIQAELQALQIEQAKQSQNQNQGQGGGNEGLVEPTDTDQ